MSSHISQSSSLVTKVDDAELDDQRSVSDASRHAAPSSRCHRNQTSGSATATDGKRLSSQPCAFRKRARRCVPAAERRSLKASQVCPSDNMAHAATRDVKSRRDEVTPRSSRLHESSEHRRGSTCRFRSTRPADASPAGNGASAMTDQSAGATAVATPPNQAVSSTDASRSPVVEPVARPSDGTQVQAAEAPPQEKPQSVSPAPGGSFARTGGSAVAGGQFWGGVYSRCAEAAQVSTKAVREVIRRTSLSFSRSTPVATLSSRLRGEGGFSTAEYAVGLLAAVGLAGLLHVVLTSDTVQEALESMVSGALS